jgi:hypothetical protein
VRHIRAPIIRGEDRTRRVLNKIVWLGIDIGAEDKVTEPPPLVAALAWCLAVYGMFAVVTFLILHWTVGLSGAAIEAALGVVASAAVFLFVGSFYLGLWGWLKSKKEE